MLAGLLARRSQRTRPTARTAALAATQLSEPFCEQQAAREEPAEQPLAVLLVPRERLGPMSPTISQAGLVLLGTLRAEASQRLNAADLVVAAVAVDQASQEELARLSA